MSVENFWAEVSIHESETVRLVPNMLSDPNDFGSLADLHGISRKEGYQGGLVLLQAPRQTSPDFPDLARPRPTSPRSRPISPDLA